jgi:Tol biopolymer transport system component
MADGKGAILVTTPDGRDPVVVSRGVNLVGATETPPSWAPDSRRLAFNGKTDDGLGIWIGSVDGQDPVPIGEPGLSRADPAWSPDGEWIAFQGRQPEEQVGIDVSRMVGGLYIIRPDGTGQDELIRGAGGSFTYAKPQWRPDLSAPMLAYSVGDPGLYNVAVFDLGTREQTVISDRPPAETWPVWSPDGSLLAWDASDSMIRIARLDRTIVREFPTPLNYAFTWSPDGNYLLGWARETSDTRLRMRILPLDPSAQPIDIRLNGISQSHWSWQRRAP